MNATLNATANLTATAGPKLAVDGLTVAYGDTVVLDRFDLQVETGETVAVIGPSGSGKSTLLRAVAGLVNPTAGSIVLDGRDLAGVAPHRRGVGLMFQDDALFPHLSVADNVGYGLDRQGMKGAERTARVAEMLALVDMDNFDERPVDQLSGGEAQRVALARALAPSPGLLMLDEPLGSLDRVLRDQLIDDLNRLLGGMGQTSLHVTHDQAEAFALADRVAVLDHGRLMALGTPGELWANPGSRFVARFLGRPNVWTLAPAGDARVRWTEADVTLPTVSPSAVSPSAVTPLAAPVTGAVVVPVGAVSVADPSGGGAVSGTVSGSRFARGRFRHRVEVDVGPAVVGSAVAGPAFIEFDDDVGRRVGERLQLTVDLSQLIPLPHDF